MPITWIENWLSAKYTEFKQREVETILEWMTAKHPDFRPQRMLEIGSGLAQDSRIMQAKWGCDCYLIDIDRAPEHKRRRHNNWGPADDMAAYNPFDRIHETLARIAPEFEYTLWDGNRLPDTHIQFDFVYSNRSMGFHYPASTYRSWIKQHSHPKTIMMALFRKSDKEPIDHQSVRMLDTVINTRKYHISTFEYK